MASEIEKDLNPLSRNKVTNPIMKLTGEWRHFIKNRGLFTLSLPGIIYVLVLAYLPMFGVIIAFKDYRYDKGILGSNWIGFHNFSFFFKSADFWRITRNTIFYNIGFIVITTVVSLLLAVLLNEVGKRGVKIYQTALFLPFFISWVVVSYIVYAFLDNSNGLVNHLLASMGLHTINWYQKAIYWPYILNIVNLWKSVGFSTLVYYAGILGIDSTYYEAARIDGATKMQIVTKVTLPLLSPLISILLIMAIGGIFRADFGLFYFVPNNSSFLYPTTDVIDTYVFRALRSLGDIGMSSAVGLYQSIVGFIFVLCANLVVKKINEENSLW